MIRYIKKPSRYHLHAHDPEGGWCDLGEDHAEQSVTDCGEHSLTRGGAIIESVPPDKQIKVTAVAPDRVRIKLDQPDQDGSFRVEVLRPGL
ncbi:MAG: hypothetical protein ACI8XO_003248 [Verrucomicrobiales bacterium]